MGSCKTRLEFVFEPVGTVRIDDAETACVSAGNANRGGSGKAFQVPSVVAVAPHPRDVAVRIRLAPVDAFKAFTELVKVDVLAVHLGKHVAVYDPPNVGLPSLIHKVLEPAAFDKSTARGQPGGDDVSVEALSRSFGVLK